MNSILEKHLGAVNNSVNKYGYLDKNTVSTAAQSFTEITIEAMDGFAEWCSDNKYEYMSDHQWLDFEGKTIFTQDLRNLYIKTVNQ